jgi:hypothetical protein
MKRCLAEGRRRFEIWVAARRARQQPHEDRRPVGGPIIAQTKSRLTIPLKSLHLRRTISALDFAASAATIQRALREIITKIASEDLSNPEIRRQFTPIFIGEMPCLCTNAGVSRQKLD